MKRSYALVAATCLLLLAGCRSARGPRRALLVFPTPPARPRIQFLTTFNGAEGVRGKTSAFEDFVLGEERQEGRVIDKPYGVAARDGVVYVCDTKGIGLCRLDFRNRTYAVLGTRGPGRLRKPINVVIDSLGYKFVADPVRKEVVVFGPDDRFVKAFPVPEPCRPVDVAVYGDELFVLDNDESCQIVVMDRRSGAVLRTFGEPGGGPGQFKIPNSLCVDADGNLYVSDTHNWRIQKLTREGKPIWQKGMAGYHLGQFGRPRGIRAAADGVLYVVDGATEIVQMFDTEGRTLMYFGGPGNTPGALVLPASLAVDASSLPYFKQYIHPDFKAEYLLFAASQYGRNLISVYAFGAFPEGYRFSAGEIAELPKAPPEKGIGDVGGRPEPVESPHSGLVPPQQETPPEKSDNATPPKDDAP